VPLSGAAFADLPDVKPFVKPQGGFLVGKPPGVEDAKAAADKVGHQYLEAMQARPCRLRVPSFLPPTLDQHIDAPLMLQSHLVARVMQKAHVAHIPVILHGHACSCSSGEDGCMDVSQ
jgi:hypothetical protein